MNTMEITKFVGALCGSLLVFLLIGTAASSIFSTSSDVVAFRIEVEEAEDVADEASAEAVDVAALVAAADPDAGQGVFRRCAACHKVDGSNGVGPHLDGVVGRDIASVDGFNYSATLSGMDGDWSYEDLYAFIENPRGYAEGTSMAFAGLSNSGDRANVIAYLESVGN